jgi:uncharacterized membrane protein
MTNPGSNISADAAARARITSQQHHSRRRGSPGVCGMLGRFVGFVVALAILAVVVGVFVTILSQAGAF